jgi:tetratricopeptide (TPR) repeat protein
MKDQVGSDDPSKMYRTPNGELLNYYPVKRVSIPVDKSVVRQNGTASSKDSNVVDLVKFEIAKGYLFKNDLAILNVIAANKWKRPIYFTQPMGLGFDDYLRQDGMSWRMVPVANVGNAVNVDWMLDKIMNKFKYGNADKKSVYYDEENRRHLLSIRNAHTILAMNLNMQGRKEEAKKVLQKADKMISDNNMPYAMASRYGNDHNEKSIYFGMAAFEAGDAELGKKVLEKVKKDCQQQIAYYEALTDVEIGPSQNFEYEKAKEYIEMIDSILKQNGIGATPSPEQSPVIKPPVDTIKK